MDTVAKSSGKAGGYVKAAARRTDRNDDQAVVTGLCAGGEGGQLP